MEIVEEFLTLSWLDRGMFLELFLATSSNVLAVSLEWIESGWIGPAR